MSIQVDGKYEQFLQGLANPLSLNEMRTMKEKNYQQFRELLSNYTGSPVLRLMKENQEALGLDPEVFDLVYEGFWDLYSFHPQCMDLSARKLQVWIQKIVLSVRPGTEVEPVDDAKDDDDEAKDGDDDAAEKRPLTSTREMDRSGADKIDPIDAVVRVKIPKVPKEPELDDDGNEIPDETPESDLDDIPFEDRCLQINASTDTQKIWIVNNLANKTLRHELSGELRNYVEKLEHVDSADFNFRLDKECALFEEAFFKLFEDSPENQTSAPKVPVFDYRPKY